MIFADTNILLRSVDTSAPHYRIVENALAKLRGREETLCIAPQNVVEFWSVATRAPGENGLGMPASRAMREITAMLRLFHLLPYRQDVLETWRGLVIAHNVSGKQAHDAHIVAMMQVHSVASILTFNDGHFKRYQITNSSGLLGAIRRTPARAHPAGLGVRPHYLQRPFRFRNIETMNRGKL